MIWITLAVVFGLIAIICLIAVVGGLIEGYWAVVAIGLVVLVVCVFAAIRSGIAASRQINRTDCTNFAEQTGYETKLIITTVFDGGECLVQFDGRWVPRTQLWAEVGPTGE